MHSALRSLPGRVERTRSMRDSVWRRTPRNRDGQRGEARGKGMEGTRGGGGESPLGREKPFVFSFVSFLLIFMRSNDNKRISPVNNPTMRLSKRFTCLVHPLWIILSLIIRTREIRHVIFLLLFFFSRKSLSIWIILKSKEENINVGNKMEFYYRVNRWWWRLDDESEITVMDKNYVVSDLSTLDANLNFPRGIRVWFRVVFFLGK